MPVIPIHFPFYFQSGKEVNKFEGVPYEVKGFLPVLKDGCGYITCKVIDITLFAIHPVGSPSFQVVIT